MFLPVKTGMLVILSDYGILTLGEEQIIVRNIAG